MELVPVRLLLELMLVVVAFGASKTSTSTTQVTTRPPTQSTPTLTMTATPTVTPTVTTPRPHGHNYSHLAGQPFGVAKESDFQMVVLLSGYLEEHLVRTCTGTLITDEFILTAASCCCDKAFTFYASSPTCTTLDTCYNMTVEKHHVHPSFFKSSKHDGLFCNNVALLKLLEPWENKLKFAQLPETVMHSDLARTFRLCYAVSYDAYMYEEAFNELNVLDPDMSNLTETPVRLVPVQRACSYLGHCESMECRHMYRYTYTQFTSADSGFCEADFGSPLFCVDGDNIVQYGIRAHTSGCDLGRYTINSYVRVDHYAHWIKFVMSTQP